MLVYTASTLQSMELLKLVDIRLYCTIMPPPPFNVWQRVAAQNEEDEGWREADGEEDDARDSAR